MLADNRLTSSVRNDTVLKQLVVQCIFINVGTNFSIALRTAFSIALEITFFNFFGNSVYRSFENNVSTVVDGGILRSITSLFCSCHCVHNIVSHTGPRRFRAGPGDSRIPWFAPISGLDTGVFRSIAPPLGLVAVVRTLDLNEVFGPGDSRILY